MSETMKTAVFRDVKKIELETCDKPGAAGIGHLYVGTEGLYRSE